MKIWAIVAVAVIIGASVAIFGFSNDTPQSTVSDIESNDIKSQGVTTTLTPEIITIKSTSKVISSEDYTGEVTTDYLKTQSYLPELDFEKAYAVTSSQSSITVTTWEGATGPNLGFDSSWNLFSGEQLQISFVNKTDLTKKTWILPNDEKLMPGELKSGVDSNGDLFFGKRPVLVSASTDFTTLAKLTPTTNVFTTYQLGVDVNEEIRHVMIDSSDIVFFLGSDDLFKLDTTTNLLTNWNAIGSSVTPYLDSSGNVYTVRGSVRIFDTNTDTLTSWHIPNIDHIRGITPDSSGNIFLLFNDGVRNKVGKIDVSENILTEWIIPNSAGTGRAIAVDSNGNVFFGGLIRFVPSTDTFTFFSEAPSCTFIEIDSSDIIHCANGNSFSEIT